MSKRTPKNVGRSIRRGNASCARAFATILARRETGHLIQDVGHHGTARIAVIVPTLP